MKARIDRFLLLILLANGLIWLRSSYGKFASGNFVGELARTLDKFASKNPYPWYKDFLRDIAIPNSQTFGLLTLWGELFTALSLTLASVYLLFSARGSSLVNVLLLGGLVTGGFLNIIFWLAAGWTGPSTDSLNLIMLAAQTVGLLAVLRATNRW